MADQGAEGKLSPFLRARRFAAAAPYLNGRILDVGCGSGGLAALVDPEYYVGVEVDPDSLRMAQATRPGYRFENRLPEGADKFDTVVALAVIEHVPSASAFLRRLAQHLANENSSLVCTTPHPALEWVHDLGAAMGLFSKHANEEHEELLDRQKLADAATEAGLIMTTYEPFLWGANQLAVFKRQGSDR